MKNGIRLIAVVAFLAAFAASGPSKSNEPSAPLWRVYEDYLKQAKYVDLTHTINPSIPVYSYSQAWSGR